MIINTIIKTIESTRPIIEQIKPAFALPGRLPKESFARTDKTIPAIPKIIAIGPQQQNESTANTIDKIPTIKEASAKLFAVLSLFEPELL